MQKKNPQISKTEAEDGKNQDKKVKNSRSKTKGEK